MWQFFATPATIIFAPHLSCSCHAAALIFYHKVLAQDDHHWYHPSCELTNKKGFTMNGIKDAITELERIFTALLPLFNKDMPKPVITIQSKGRKRCLAWFVEDKWQNDQEEPLAEINICAESLARACPRHRCDDDARDVSSVELARWHQGLHGKPVSQRPFPRPRRRCWSGLSEKWPRVGRYHGK